MLTEQRCLPHSGDRDRVLDKPEPVDQGAGSVVSDEHAGSASTEFTQVRKGCGQTVQQPGPQSFRRGRPNRQDQLLSVHGDYLEVDHQLSAPDPRMVRGSNREPHPRPRCALLTMPRAATSADETGAPLRKAERAHQGRRGAIHSQHRS